MRGAEIEGLLNAGDVAVDYEALDEILGAAHLDTDCPSSLSRLGRLWTALSESDAEPSDPIWLTWDEVRGLARQTAATNEGEQLASRLEWLVERVDPYWSEVPDDVRAAYDVALATSDRTFERLLSERRDYPGRPIRGQALLAAALRAPSPFDALSTLFTKRLHDEGGEVALVRAALAEGRFDLPVNRTSVLPGASPSWDCIAWDALPAKELKAVLEAAFCADPKPLDYWLSEVVPKAFPAPEERLRFLAEVADGPGVWRLDDSTSDAAVDTLGILHAWLDEIGDREDVCVAARESIRRLVLAGRIDSGNWSDGDDPLIGSELPEWAHPFKGTAS